MYYGNQTNNINEFIRRTALVVSTYFETLSMLDLTSHDHWIILGYVNHLDLQTG